MMNDNVYEIASHPAFVSNNRLNTIAHYSSSQERDFRSVAKLANEIAEGLKRESVEADSLLKVVLAGFEDTDVSIDDCWKLTETNQGGAPLLNIFTGETVKTYSYYLGFVLTKRGEILEYEKAGNAEDDMSLVHVVDKFRGIYLRKGLLAKRCYVDESIMISLDDLAQKAGLNKYS